MDDNLAAFIAPLTAFREEKHAWSVGRFHLACYLTDRTPPGRYVVSARAVVTDGDRVVVVQDPTSRHILPGGRLEPEETMEEALRREVLEETGWKLARFRQIGIMHFRHIDPMPDDYPYPYPDLIHVVYAATPGEHRPELRDVDGYELGAELVPLDEARRLDLDAGQHTFLDAALRAEERVRSAQVPPTCR